MGFLSGSRKRQNDGDTVAADVRPGDRPGYVRGRHFTEYVEEVRALKRRGEIQGAETLLLELVEATESESAYDGYGVAPWYYGELAKVYRSQRDPQKEVAILERFAAQKHHAGVRPRQLLQRLEKARSLAAPR